MHKLNHKATSGSIKPDNAKKIAEAIINIKLPTRKDIAKHADVSEMTVCRALAILDESGFIEERAADNQHISKLRITPDPSLSFIVIDVNDPDYCAYLLSADSTLIEEHRHTFNPTLDADQNLSICLDRAKMKFSLKANGFSGVGVIFNDESYSDPNICRAIEESLECPITATMTEKDCISSLRGSSIDSHFPCDSMYYLNIGNNNLAYFINKDCIIKSNPSILVDASGKTCGDLISSCITPEQAYEIIYNIINSASAMLDPQLFIVESDRFILGKSTGAILSERLKLSINDKRRLLISDARPSYKIKGALITLQKEIIKSILSK